MWRRLPICLTVCMGWSPGHTVTGMTRTPSFRKCPTEGRRLSEVVACEVRVLPSSLGRQVRPACCLWLWLWTVWRVPDVPRVVSNGGSESITSFASSCASSSRPTVFFAAFVVHRVGELASRPRDDPTRRQQWKPRQQCGFGEVVLGIGGCVVLGRGSRWVWGWGGHDKWDADVFLGRLLSSPPPLSASGPSLPPTVRVSPRQTTGPVTCHGSGF